jgi:hypothetical protein
MAVDDSLPYAVKGSKVIWMVKNDPPPRPLCFDTMAQWQTYLMYLAASGERITRRQDLGKHSGRRTVTTVFDRIDYCADCDVGGLRQRRMASERRCILPGGLRPWASTPATKGVSVLHRLATLLQQLKYATNNGQISMVPGEEGTMAIVVAWEEGGHTFEVAQAFGRAEIAQATEEDIAQACDLLVASAWAQVSEGRGEDMTPEKALNRIREAARQSVAAQAHTVLATAAGRTQG